MDWGRGRPAGPTPGEPLRRGPLDNVRPNPHHRPLPTPEDAVKSRAREE